MLTPRHTGSRKFRSGKRSRQARSSRARPELEKAQRARELLAELAAAGYEPVAADFQSIYAALLLLERLPDGRYPERLDVQSYILAMVEFLRTAMIRNALEDDRPVVVTISEPPSGARHAALLALFGGQARQETIDPGLEIILDRLAVDGVVSDSCIDAAGRWFGREVVEQAVTNRPRTRRRRMVL